jgi:aminopeptidase N
MRYLFIDAGPMSHPIRPDSYISMDNFYTATVYSKGAEIIRMYNTILSEEGFRKGMDLYFERHDGTGVTCDDFRAAMADANGVDLDQFGLWYSTSGTPTVTYSTEFDEAKGTFNINLTQSSNSDLPLFIPVSIGLIDKATGEEVLPTTVLELKEESQSFTFDGLNGDVVPSILRQFSAPVKIVSETGEVDEESLKFLAARDTDGFNRWEAGQRLFTSLCFQVYNNGEMSDETLDYVFEAFERTIEETSMDFSIKAYAMTLPSEGTLSEELQEVDPEALHKARGTVRKAIARKFQKQLLDAYNALSAEMGNDGEFKVDAESVGRRRLRNTLLGYLTSIKESDEEQKAAAEIALAHYDTATGMTDKMAALNALVSMDGAAASTRDEVIQRFYDEANGDALVLNKWFSVQALADLPDVLDRVKALTKHPDFTLSNPNRCRSLISAFTMNLAPFHAKDGEGYKFIAKTIADLDKLNPQISSRMGTRYV